MVERNIQSQDVPKKSFKADYEKGEFLGEGAFGEVYAVVRK